MNPHRRYLLLACTLCFAGAMSAHYALGFDAATLTRAGVVGAICETAIYLALIAGVTLMRARP